MHFSYSRYIENKLREAFGFEGSPIEIIFEKKNQTKEYVNNIKRDIVKL